MKFADRFYSSCLPLFHSINLIIVAFPKAKSCYFLPRLLNNCYRKVILRSCVASLIIRYIALVLINRSQFAKANFSLFSSLSAVVSKKLRASLAGRYW